MEIDVGKLKSIWAGATFDTVEFEVHAESLRDFALACGEVDPRYIDPAHPEFQASPTYTARFVGRRVLPENFPSLPGSVGFDGGKCETPLAPIRPGERVTAHSRIHDTYA